MMRVAVGTQDDIQRACPALDVQISLVGPPEVVVIAGWKSDTSDTPLILVENSSLAQAEREYRVAYSRLERFGLIGGGR